MKKLIALTAALLVFLSAIIVVPQTAYATQTGMVVVYLNVPGEWENPCLWAWDDAGNSAFSAWPGGEAESDPDNPEWYYCYLPNWSTNVIVNANDGTVQTDALLIEGKDVWITVDSPDEVAVSFDKETTGEAPEYVEKISLYAQVPADWNAPCLWAWLDPEGTGVFSAWPGGEMKESGDWYNIKVPSWINSIIINANDGTVQTGDYKDLEIGKDIWVVVADDKTAEIYYENPELMVPNITVYAQIPADWENPSLWAWSHPDGTNAFASWPGEAFTQNGDWYEITLPGWVNALIVNANGGSVQTGDMHDLEVGRDVWVVVTDAETYTYNHEGFASTGADESSHQPEEESIVTASFEPVEPLAVDTSAPDSDNVNIGLWIALGLGGAAIIVIIIIFVRKK